MNNVYVLPLEAFTKVLFMFLDLDLDKYVAGPFSIDATGERAGKNI